MQSNTAASNVPSDLMQVLTVAEHELRRFIRTRRFLGVAVLAVVSVFLVFCLPFLSGERYTGRMEEVGYPANLSSDAYPDYHSYLWLSRSDVVVNTLEIRVDGAVLQEDQWTYMSRQGPIVFFKPDLSSSVVLVSYGYSMKDVDMTRNLLRPFQYTVVFCASLLGADALIGEIQSRTAYLLFPNPLRRSTAFFGKLLSSLIVGVSFVLLHFSLTAILSQVILGTVAAHLHISLGFGILYLVTCLTLSFAMSALAKGSVGALVMTLLVLLVASPLAQAAGASAGSDVWYLPTFAADTIVYSLQWDDYPRDVTENTSVPIYYPNPETSALVLAAYSVMFMVIGVMSFRRSELFERI